MVKPDRLGGSPSEARQKERVSSGVYETAKVISSVAAAVMATVAATNAYADMPDAIEFPNVNRGMSVEKFTLNPDGVARWVECTQIACNGDDLQLQSSLDITEDGISIGEIESQNPPATPYGQEVVLTESGNMFVDYGGIISRNGEPWFDHIDGGGLWSISQYPGGRLAIALTRSPFQTGSADIFLIDEDTPSGSFTDFWNAAVPLSGINRTDRNEFGIAVFPERGEAFVSADQLREGAVDMFDVTSSRDIVRYEADRSVYDPAHRWINPMLISSLNTDDQDEWNPSAAEQVLIDDVTGDRTLASCLAFQRINPGSTFSTAMYSCVYMPAPAADGDHDLTPDSEDNCPGVANRDQADWDEDGLGDACDVDSDNDGRNDSNDPCPQNFNPNGVDVDGDDVEDACDPDGDSRFPEGSRVTTGDGMMISFDGELRYRRSANEVDVDPGTNFSA
ncbi:MAG: thrombospondin type 3 repeat-containing protein, partial [Patescibacteria group bacterium]